MSRRARLAVAAGVVALGAGAVEFAVDGPLAAVRAALAGVLAVAIAGLAWSLPRIDPRGLIVGGFFVTAGILSWSYTDKPIVVWGTLLAEGTLFLVWSRPWLRQLRESIRMGTAWLGVGYWILGVVGAALVLNAEVAAERLLYAGVFGLAVLAMIGSGRRTDRSVATGVAAAFLVAIAVLLVSGSGNLFETVHVVPPNGWGESFEYRFWGGEWLLYHPNSLAGIAVMVAIRIGPDREFAVWQRVAATALAGFVVYVTNSRTGFVFLVAGAGVHAVLLWWRRRRDVADLPDYGSTRRTLAAAALPFAVIALVLVFSDGEGFLFKERYGSGGVTSGRLDTWKQVGTEWRGAGIAEQLFGDTSTTRAVVKRESSGLDMKLTTDNAAVGALRRGGAVGVLAFGVGLGLLLWHARRRTAPSWYVVAVIASIPTIATTDWLLGGTGGTLWILLVAGEAGLLYGAGGAVTAASTADGVASGKGSAVRSPR